MVGGGNAMAKNAGLPPLSCAIASPSGAGWRIYPSYGDDAFLPILDLPGRFSRSRKGRVSCLRIVLVGYNLSAVTRIKAARRILHWGVKATQAALKGRKYCSPALGHWAF